MCNNSEGVPKAAKHGAAKNKNAKVAFKFDSGVHFQGFRWWEYKTWIQSGNTHNTLLEASSNMNNCVSIALLRVDRGLDATESHEKQEKRDWRTITRRSRVFADDCQAMTAKGHHSGLFWFSVGGQDSRIT